MMKITIEISISPHVTMIVKKIVEGILWERVGKASEGGLKTDQSSENAYRAAISDLRVVR